MIIFMTNVEELWIIEGVGPDRYLDTLNLKIDTKYN